jgi:hypothetical protein
VERLAGAHCYEFYAGRADFARLADEEPATFWLTDFLARNFERLVIRGLGIDRHPELEGQYFGNYRRVVYLAQTDDPDLLAMARRAADRLGLAFEHRHTGFGDLATSIRALRAIPPAESRPTGTSDVAERSMVEPSRTAGAIRRSAADRATHTRPVGNPAAGGDWRGEHARGTGIGASASGPASRTERA